VEVNALRDDTFYGNIVAEVNGRTLNIDARPSDALNLAVRAHVPIFVARSVMDAAGIIPEEDLQSQEPKQIGARQAPETEPEAEESEERLSIFEDFLEKLDLGDEGDEEKPDDHEDE
jgi:bifunctional DNase/RNase